MKTLLKIYLYLIPLTADTYHKITPIFNKWVGDLNEKYYGEEIKQHANNTQ